MELVRRWLAHLDTEGGAALAADLATLPGRDPYARGPGASPAIQAAEWSVREGSEALRFAWNVDEGRVPVSAVFSVLERWGGFSEEVRALEASLQGVHLQVGRDGERVKLYVYGAGAARSGGGPRSGGGCADFVAFDLPARTASPAIKHYFQLDRPDALAYLRDLDAASLAAWAESLPDDLGTPPGRFVVSVRSVATEVRDVTLHVKVDLAPERLVELAGAELAGRLAVRFREAARMGLELRPTYVSRLAVPGGAGGHALRTVYYRLVPR